MAIKQHLKRWLYGHCPGFAGSFPYFGLTVHFPPGAPGFLHACEHGIVEADHVRLLQAIVRPGTWYFDVGANIGLLSVPVLQTVPDAHVVSFEPSPNALPWLARTLAESPHSARWTIIPKAAGAEAGRVQFNVAAARDNSFDGIRDTGRAAIVRTVEVEVTTIDAEWQRLGRPAISAIKIDVEGHELSVLRGAADAVATCRPAVLLEWSAGNLVAYGHPVAALLQYAAASGMLVYALPHMVQVQTQVDLRMQMLRTENFLLWPADSRPAIDAHQ